MGLPERPPRAIDWQSVEEALGTRLPADYKDLIARYPELVVGGFIRVLGPHGRFPSMDIVAESQSNQSWLEYITEEAEHHDEAIPYVAYPAPGGILRWGVTTNGDYCHWRTGPGDPDEWTIVVSEGKGDEWTEFAGGLGAFIEALFLARSTVPCFRGDWPHSGSTTTFRDRGDRAVSA
ncbi:SMI1/KNR4 family protein [Yinghuangia seranimata]|uniref:SMI1/KNR4 family protein n=1 Tax=Yinghuangia seranimata TaxID=408067 RepID=UPI00248C4AD9|nr:SMI1/KNR4 family protein [Yinghuangia seranimata]MDI2127589.1 SMI1/KNR4 family protein [Yinghuangia seranimata]